MTLKLKNTCPGLLTLAAVVADQVAAELGLGLTVVGLGEDLRVVLPEETPDRLREVFVAHLADRLFPNCSVQAFYRELDVDGVITIFPLPTGGEGEEVEAEPLVPEEAQEEQGQNRSGTGGGTDLERAMAQAPSALAVALNDLEVAQGESGSPATGGQSAPSTSLSPSVGGPVRRRGRPPGSKSRPADSEP